MLDLQAPAAAQRPAELSAAEELEHAARRTPAGHLVDRFNRPSSVMYEVEVREIPTRSPLSLKRNVVGDGARGDARPSQPRRRAFSAARRCSS